MANNNKISKIVDNPLTNPESEFYIEDKTERHRYLTAQVFRDKRDNPLFKKARYIYVYKVRESENSFRLRGSVRWTRYYAISILTDDNRYYYNEYRSKHSVVSARTASDMSRIFLDGYVLDQDTSIMADSEIKDHEPLMTYLMIVSRTLGIPVRRKSAVQLLGRIQNLIKSIPRGKKGKVTIYRKKYVMEALLEGGWLDFLPQRILDVIKDSDSSPAKRNTMFFCALGILVMFKSGPRKDAV